MVKSRFFYPKPYDDFAQIAALIVQVASRYESSIYIVYGVKMINAKSLMGVMAFQAEQGEEITIVAEGVDEEDAIVNLELLLVHRNTKK